MKIKKTLIVMFSLAQFFGFSQREKIYDSKGNDKKVTSESTHVDLKTRDDSPELKNPGAPEALGAITASLIGVGVDVVFKSIETYLEDRAKKFAGEYTALGINDEMSKRRLPDIEFKRKAAFDGSTGKEDVLIFTFKPIQITREKKVKDGSGTEKTETEFVPIAYYEVQSYGLKGSKSLTKSKWNLLDYVIEITLYFYKDVKGDIKEKKEVKLSPIMIKRLGFTETMTNDLSAEKYRTNTFIMPYDSFVGEVNVKIAETNPRKNSAEKILEYYTEYKDDLRTIVNNYLPEKDEDDNSSDSTSGGGTNTNNNDGSGTGNTQDQQTGGKVPTDKQKSGGK